VRLARGGLAFLKKAPLGYPFVVKADGLAAGKGTVVVGDAAEAKVVVEQIMAEKKFGSAGAKVVMEEFLQGEEVSFLVFSDGARVVPMASVQDHKRALDGDQGPNTGGMGPSPRPRVSASTPTSASCRRSSSHGGRPRAEAAGSRACCSPAS